MTAPPMGPDEGPTYPPSPAERRASARAAERAAVLAERQAKVALLQAEMPAAMRERPQWLLWRFMERAGAKKPPKVPFYANGHMRGWPHGRPRDGQPTEAQPRVDQSHALDRAHLVTLDEAIAAFNRRPDWSGIGFAFLQGDGLIGIDVDHAIDAATGRPSDLCRLVVESCASYTELSPSGTGVHVIVAGETTTFKDDRIGLEVYAGLRYFTCTGVRCSGGVWPETPAEVMPVDPVALAYLRELVEASRKEQADERAAAAAAAAGQLAATLAPAVADEAGAAAPSPAPPPSAPAPVPASAPAAPAGVGGGGDDFKRVNDVAMGALQAWVLALLPEARASAGGYRVSSKDLGRELQEDLSIKPDGIVDFGVADMGDARQGKRTPIDLVLEYGARVGVAKPAEALRWLANVLGVPLSKPQLRRVPSTRPPEPPPEGEARPALDGAPRASGEGAGPAPVPEDDEAAGDDDDSPQQRAKRRARETAALLRGRFALIYGTDTAWDDALLRVVSVQSMRLTFGRSAVSLWLDHPKRRLILPEDLVFEPGQQVPPGKINMWAGLALEPLECTEADVQPMLDLLRHLCSETRIAGSADAVAETMTWILRWQALPLQRLGAKMQTALIFHGAQGTGKNLYFDAWRDLYGDAGVTVGQTEVDDKYNGWVSRKLAIVGDEVVSRQEMYHNKNRLKLVVTQEKKFAIRSMFKDTHWESNHANVAFLSNEGIPLALEDRDRRYMVVYTPLEAAAEVYQRVTAFLANEGLRKWLYFLQHYDLGDFGEHTKPLMTAAKQDLIEANWRPSARFVAEWLGGYTDLPVRVCSSEQLYRAFRRWAEQAGVKWMPERSTFTNEVNRWVKENVKRGPDGRFERPALDYKQVALNDHTGPRKTVRCWLPQGTGPLPGISEGEWAAECVKTFEADLYRFCRRAGVGEDEQ